MTVRNTSLQSLKEKIEKMAQDMGPTIPPPSKGPTQHAIHYRPVSNPGAVQTPAPQTGNVKEMQSRILDVSEILKPIGVEIKPIGTKNLPDGGWGLKTNDALKSIGDYLASVYPLWKELKKEGVLHDDPNQGALDWFRSQIPNATKNVVPLTPTEKEDRAGEFVKALKYFGSLINQFVALSRKGQYRSLFEGNDVIAKFPSNKQLLKGQGKEDPTDEIQSVVEQINKTDPNAALNVQNENGSISIPIKALTTKEQFLDFTSQMGLDEAGGKKFFESTVKPAAQSLKVV